MSLTTPRAQSLCLSRCRYPKAGEGAGVPPGRGARWEHLPSAPGRMHGCTASREKNLSRDGNTQGSGRENERARNVFVSSFISQTAVC